MTSPVLAAHRILLCHPFVWPASFRPEEQGFIPCTRGQDEGLRLYLTASAHALLHEKRWEHPGPFACRLSREGRPELVATALRVELCQAGAAMGLLCLVLNLEEDSGTRPSADDLRDLADLGRLRGPWYPGQLNRIVWEGPPGDGPLSGLLTHLLPGCIPAFEDPRLFCLLFAAFEDDPGAAERFALCAVDPSGMPPPPDDELLRFFRENAYRRWERAGTFWAFTHYSGAVIMTRGAATWMARLMEHQYLDLLGFTVLVAARRRLIGRQHDQDPVAQGLMLLGEKERVYERERFSEQDQGRQLMRLWLQVIDADYGDRAVGWRETV